MKKDNILLLLILVLLMLLSGSVIAEQYSYDGAGRLTGVTYSDGTAIAYLYDAAGNRTKKIGSAGVTHPPIPTATEMTTTANQKVTSQVNHNDVDVGDSHRYTITTLPNHGSATVSNSGLVEYTPTIDFTGSDQLSVTVTDSTNQSAAITIVITINEQPAGGTNPPSSSGGGGALSWLMVIALLSTLLGSLYGRTREHS